MKPVKLPTLDNMSSSLMTFPRFSAFFVLCLYLTGCASTGTTVSEDAVSPDAVAASSNDDVAVNSYTLGQGDSISIQVFDEVDLTLTTVVGSSGSINYSYLGDIKVAGKTPQQLEQDITKLLQDGFLVNPSVNVTVVQFRPFYINGEVRSPGGYPYQPGLTLDKAIALAGGLTDRASTRKMFLTKSDESSQQSIKVVPESKIAPGDIITIKEGFF